MFDYHVILVTFAFMVFDIVSGFIKAVKNQNVSSTKMRDGLFHKCGLVGAVVLAMLCEYSMVYVDIGFTVPLLVPVCVYIIGTEFTSIVENLKATAPELANGAFMKIFGNDDE